MNTNFLYNTNTTKQKTRAIHCPVCGKEIRHQTIDQIVDKVKALGEGTKIQVLAPIARGKKGNR